jgi:hypothetical protein
MASTYSNLKIQLMATGENSGTWGNVTNTNLGTALEQAITGSVDVTVNSDTTLSLTDTNAAQNARALRLNLTGSGAANLTVPAIQKLYLINNATLGTVTVKNATGATIAVPTTKTMWVFSTGTGVVDAVTHLTSLTLGSALPIASGGTGSTSTTYANLQSNVTGTLPVANGGTGSVTLTSEAVIIGNTTSAVKFVSPGTTGNVLTSNGTAWTSAAAAAFDAGTVMIFAQTSAPTGWTKLTNLNDYALRVVSGAASTGGSTAFSTVFANQTPTINVGGLSAGATTLSNTQIPGHTHTLTLAGKYGGNFGGADPAWGYDDNVAGGTTATTASSGGGGSHSHSISGSATSSAITLNVLYVDVIRASKN